MRVAFLGTPDPAARVLTALAGAGHDIELVVSRPDARRGRGQQVSPSPVKAAALSLGLRVTDDLAELKMLEPELGIVVAYGRMIPAQLVERTPMLNIHYSLLPRWRGAAPVERAILAGDRETGVSVMRLTDGLDEGPVLARRTLPVSPIDTTETLTSRLTEAGIELLNELLSAPLPPGEPQAGEVSYASKITSDDRALRMNSMTAEELDRIVRIGGAWARSDGRRVKIARARLVGSLGDVSTEEVGVVRPDGVLAVTKVVPEGARPMPASDWVRGRRSTDPLFEQ